MKRIEFEVIKITREEADIFRKQMPSTHIAIVNRHTSHKRYFIEENKQTLALLSELRDDPKLMPKGAPQVYRKHR